MDFRKKLKIRLAVAISYIALGVLIILAAIFTKAENTFYSSLGFCLFVIGIVRVRNHRLITKSEETLRVREISEQDERNVFIAEKARSWAFAFYIIISGLVVIALNCFGKVDLASIIGGTVCGLILIYWICYWFIYKKS